MTTVDPSRLAARFAEIAAQFRPADDLAQTLRSLVAVSMDLMPGVEAAGLSVLEHRGFRSLATSGELPTQVDAIQYELRSGPCVDAVLEDTWFVANDLRSDPRWPEFGRRATDETGVRAMMAHRLHGEAGDPPTGLNIYATRSDAFDEEAQATGLVLATHAGVLLLAAGRGEKIANLEQALQSNRDIGAAIGVMMTRLLITRQQAFDLLRIASQRTNRKIADIAVTVIETGVLEDIKQPAKVAV